MDVLLACVCVFVCMCRPGTFGGQKRMSDPLELKIQMVVSHQVLGTGTKLGSLQEQEVNLAIDHLYSTHHGFLTLLNSGSSSPRHHNAVFAE